jgi:putative serine protease PepD
MTAPVTVSQGAQHDHETNVSKPIKQKEVFVMVDPEYFPQPPPELAPAAPPTTPPTPPPPRRGRRVALGALAALTMAASAGMGAGAVMVFAPSATPVAAASTTTASTTALTTTGSSAATIYQAVVPGVVTITDSISNARGQAGQGTGSGIVVDTKGDILTNQHVIAGASQIQVTFSDGSTVAATLVGSDTAADLAVVHVNVAASSLHPVSLGNSSTLQVGDTVYAIGSPFGLSESLTAGIVSGLNRSGSSTGGSVSGLIQTDAPINPGNSGGALVNTQGQVVGINNSIESPVDGNVGVGFAIPINQVTQLLPALESGSQL